MYSVQVEHKISTTMYNTRSYPFAYQVILLKLFKLSPTWSCISNATATHNFKWMNITHICITCDQTFANFDVSNPYVFLIALIWSDNKTK